jgi:hypothetical protein
MNLGYVAWKDNLSWMEKQEGARWEALLKQENTQFTEELDDLKIPSFKKTSSDGIRWRGWKIVSDPFSPQQVWSRGDFKVKCWDIDMSEDLVAAAVQQSTGHEQFSVEIYKLEKSQITHLKTIHNTGPTVAVIDGTIWFLGSDSNLRYNSIKSWSGNLQTHYVSSNLKENLEIIRGEDNTVYVRRSNFLSEKFCLIPSCKTWLDKPHLQSCIVSQSLKLPGIQDTIEALSLKAGWVVSRNHGIRTLWKIEKHKIKPITWIWGDITYDSRNPYTLEVSDIRYEHYTIHLPKWILSNPKPHKFPCSYHEYPLPAFVVHPSDEKRPRGLLITAYGAYGTVTHVGSLISKWKPLLEKGWIVVSVMVPGSGDHDLKWMRSGQRLNRIESIRAFKESIEALKEEYGMDSSKVALYGRSAGGLLVSSVAIINPGLVGALYLESPYIDVLKTISNPKLPLTTLETYEFGSSNNPSNIIETATWSPMEHIPKEGISQLFVIARTDRNDLEVFPYEVLKFIKRIRSKYEAHKKLVFIHEGRGHFTTTWKTRAEDIALLDNWLTNTRSNSE